MEVKINIDYEQLISLIKQLPDGQKKKLMAELNDTPHVPADTLSLAEFQKLLLNGPIMSREEEERFINTRERFKLWRKKLSF